MSRAGPATIDRSRLAALHRAERSRYVAARPASARLAVDSARHFAFGVPLHWMRDWPLPHPLFVVDASGNRLRCADGIEHVDCCLGDGAALFGHAAPAVAQALAAQASRGLSTMLPAPTLPRVGAALAHAFGLPRWQLALSASDANRFVLRWARAITGRPNVLVFDGCYHGTVADTLVDRSADGRASARASLLGATHDQARTTHVVPFNDAGAFAAALEADDVACVLCEPALTNAGLVLPRAGFLEALQQACRAHGTLFVLDETHTLATGYGGYARVHGLDPDIVVIGKAIAGGVPCAVYGCTEAVAVAMEDAKRAAPEGHSGIGTTLAGSALALAALDAALAEVIVPAAYDRMLDAARALETGLAQRIDGAGVGWCVTRLGARMEVQYRPAAPTDAAQARAAADPALSQALHLYALNRGVVLTPFHDMLLVAPQTTADDVTSVLDVFEGFVAEVVP